MEKKNTWVWVVIVILILLGIWYFVTKNKNVVEPVIQQDAIASDTVGPDSVQDTTEVAGVPAQPAISYANALTKYAGRMIQLDSSCQARPVSVTYKDNTGIMIDNRSPVTRTIKIGTTFTIKPYGFKIVTLPDVYLKSSTILVDCDKMQNVATILVQE